MISKKLLDLLGVDPFYGNTTTEENREETETSLPEPKAKEEENPPKDPPAPS